MPSTFAVPTARTRVLGGALCLMGLALTVGMALIGSGGVCTPQNGGRLGRPVCTLLAALSVKGLCWAASACTAC
ncbi:MAG: hypothetical protein LH480_00075 [Rubrivivax sp.]|nr:hypothetical protein [Rubrivivax sp.]